MYFKHPSYTYDVIKIAKLPFPWEKLNGKSILITGATGMIGTVLIDVLMYRNYSFQDHLHIYALGRNVERARERFKEYWNDADFSFITSDINEEQPLSIKFDYLFHCASNTHPRSYAQDPIGTIMTNVIGTNHVLQMALRSSAERTVFLSSVEIYGENRGDTDTFSEDYCGYIDCNTLRAGYPEGKRAGEALCQAYIQKFNLDIVIPRICRVYGPTMLDSDSKALAQFIHKAVNGENIVLKSKGDQFFSYCYVADVVSALLYILFYGETGKAYNVSDQTGDIRLRDLAAILAEFAGKKVIYELPDEIEQKGYSKASDARLNSTHLQKLGWKVEDSIKEQLKKTVEIMKSRS